eukprot:g5934.t1
MSSKQYLYELLYHCKKGYHFNNPYPVISSDNDVVEGEVIERKVVSKVLEKNSFSCSGTLLDSPSDSIQLRDPKTVKDPHVYSSVSSPVLSHQIKHKIKDPSGVFLWKTYYTKCNECYLLDEKFCATTKSSSSNNPKTPEKQKPKKRKESNASPKEKKKATRKGKRRKRNASQSTSENEDENSGGDDNVTVGEWTGERGSRIYTDCHGQQWFGRNGWAKYQEDRKACGLETAKERKRRERKELSSDGDAGNNAVDKGMGFWSGKRGNRIYTSESGGIYSGRIAWRKYQLDRKKFLEDSESD